MEKLNNWNAWCNDKVLLHSEEGLPILLSPNAILGLQQTIAGTEIALVDGLYFSVTEKIEINMYLYKKNKQDALKRYRMKKLLLSILFLMTCIVAFAQKSYINMLAYADYYYQQTDVA